MAAASVKTVNCGVSPSGSELIFKINAELASCSITFRIESTTDGKECGVLEIAKDGNLVRKYISKPFPPGSFKYREKGSGNEKIGSAYIYKVKLEKIKSNLDLCDFFE